MLLFWIVLYGAVFSVSAQLEADTVQSANYAIILMISYPVCLLYWLIKTGKNRALRLTLPKTAAAKVCSPLFCLLLLPLYNLATAGPWKLDAVLAVRLICVSISEEVFFRGFLFFNLQKGGKHFAPWVTSVIFALAHAVNLTGTVPQDMVLLQILCAFSVSMYYCGIGSRFGSILPCIAGHTFVNLSAGSSSTEPSGWKTVGLLICVAIHLWCAVTLLHKTNLTSEENEK